jgi:CheY-like chemotaxis protein
VLEVGKVIEELRPLIARSLPESIELSLIDTGQDWRIRADRGQLEAAILNLCVNARDAMPGGGRLSIQLLLAEVDERTVELNRSMTPGEYVVIAVSDNGHGMTSDVIDHVFEPFFTTKDEGSGSGLGLSMVYGFVRQSNGDVTIYSEPGRGALVKLYLPRVNLAAGLSDESESNSARPPPGCSILLVEDDPFVRKHILGRLQELGCTVVPAANADEAMDVLRQDRHFDVLFSDVVMPGVSGIELAKRARALRPGLAILLSSGYTFEAMQHQEELDSTIRLLNKPYGKALLARTLAEVLHNAGVRDED